MKEPIHPDACELVQKVLGLTVQCLWFMKVVIIVGSFVQVSFNVSRYYTTIPLPLCSARR
jgi:hypothetical protein